MLKHLIFHSIWQSETYKFDCLSTSFDFMFKIFTMITLHFALILWIRSSLNKIYSCYNHGNAISDVYVLTDDSNFFPYTEKRQHITTKTIQTKLGKKL